jgi:hypothetical protein
VLNKVKTIKQKIVDHLNGGYCLCSGSANRLTNSQSGSRRLRDVISENSKKYGYAEIKSIHGGKFRMKFKRVGRKISIKRCDRGWTIQFRTNQFTSITSELYVTRKEAFSQIKWCK